MHVRGWWGARLPQTPTISARFYHADTRKPQYIPFMIDTGAERTYIGPLYQKILGVTKVRKETRPVQTLGGPVSFGFLTHCRLTLLDVGQQMSYDFPDETVYFSLHANAKELDHNEIPNLLGRNILNQLCLGYCCDDLLFLSDRRGEYVQKMGSLLIPPPRPWESPLDNKNISLG